MKTEFWIDVGGTFTDCLLHSTDKVTRSHKVLSSGKVQGTVRARSGANAIFDGRDRPTRRTSGEAIVCNC